MPNFDTLIDSISQIITNFHTESSDKNFSSTINLKYAYIQLNVQFDTAIHCKFNFVSGDMKSTNRFKNGFYELIEVPADLQKGIDYSIIVLRNTFCFHDDIIIVSKGCEEDHFKLIKGCDEQLDAENLCISLQKRDFAKQIL